MKKIYLAILLVLSLGVTTVFADDLLSLFGIEELGLKAIENSLELDSLELDIEMKIIDKEDAYDEAKKHDHLQGGRVTFIKNRIKVESDTLIADMEVRVAELNREKKRE
jgi:hypothetical protein